MSVQSDFAEAPADRKEQRCRQPVQDQQSARYVQQGQKVVEPRLSGVTQQSGKTQHSQEMKGHNIPKRQDNRQKAQSKYSP